MESHTSNRTLVLAVPAFKRLGQKELRGHYTAQAQMSDQRCKARPLFGLFQVLQTTIYTK